MTPVVYIIYNADGTLRGKVNYAYRKLTEPANSCAACDLTHAGLHLTESAEWSATKKKIGAEVKQLHRNELDQGTLDYVKKNGLTYPLVLGRRDAGDELKVLMTKEDLGVCSKDHAQFLTTLRATAKEKDIALADVA